VLRRHHAGTVGAPGVRRRLPQAAQHVRHVVIAERAELDLGEPVVSAQQRPDGTQAMTAGELIAAVTANQGNREAACRIDQGRQQVQARLIGPLQVVEEQRHGAAASCGGQHRAYRRGQRRRAGLGRHGAQFGHDLRENSRERPGSAADSRAQRAGHQLIGRTRPCARRLPEGDRARERGYHLHSPRPGSRHVAR
jgi:hypothetical protein